MAAPQSLQRGLRRLRRRVRALLVFRLSSLGLALAGGAGAFAVLWLRLLGRWYPLWLPPAALGAVLLVAVLAAALWALPDRTVAASADRRLGLRNRLGTAVHLARRGRPAGMEQAMLHDALRHLSRVRASTAYPLRAYSSTRAAALCLAALILIQVLPIPPLFLSPQEREERAALRLEAAKIVPVAKKLEQQAKKERNAEGQRLARRLERLALQLQRGQTDRKKALLGLKALEKDLAALEKNLAPPPMKTAAQAAEELRRAASKDLSSKARQLADQAEKRGQQALQRRLGELAKKAEEAQSATQLNTLESQLAQMAKELGISVQLPPGMLAGMSEAVAAEDWEKALEALAQQQEALSKLAGQLSEEQLQRLAEELKQLAEALKETDISELSERLGEACQALKQGDAEKAAECLAGALKEGNLKAARLALGRCAGAAGACCTAASRSLTGCQSASAGVGSGAGGTGRQESIPPNAEATRLYAPRTTETEGTLERVPGAVRPQGPMPAITERGAPTPGDRSRVPYYEVLPGYSRAAEEALSREEVPPAYRSTVRDYFNALQSGSGHPAGPERP